MASKYHVFGIVFLFSLLCYFSVHAQDVNNLYTDDAVLTANLYQRAESGLVRANAKSLAKLQEETARISSDAKIGLSGMPERNTRKLSGNDIFSDSKSGVLIVGEIFNSEPGVKPYAEIIATAFVIQSNGICVSNYHVLKNILRPRYSLNDHVHKDSSILFVETSNGDIFFPDKILAYSEANDIAVFSLKAKGRKFHALPLGTPAKVGDAVYVIAHPEGNPYYFSEGIVAKNLKSEDTLTNAMRYRMQISADYAVGSSGGPVLDKFGNVVGVVSSTHEVYAEPQTRSALQMVFKNAIPVFAVKLLLQW